MLGQHLDGALGQQRAQREPHAGGGHHLLHHDHDQPREPAAAELGRERHRPPAGLDVLPVRFAEPGRGRDLAIAVKGAARSVADPVERAHYVGHEPAALLDHPEHGLGIGMAESLELRQAIKIDKLLQNEPDVTERGNVASHGLRVSPARRKSSARHGGGAMSEPGFTRPDLCSIRAAAEQAEFAGAARACSTPTAHSRHPPTAVVRPRRTASTAPSGCPGRRAGCSGRARAIAANMAQGWSHGPVGRGGRGLASGRAWWAVMSSPGSGSSAPPGRGMTSHRQRTAAEIRCCLWSVPGQKPSTASSMAGAAAPQSDQGNFAAVAAYRLSARAGNPLSERKLAQMFGRTSRRWARARIAEARQSP